MSESRDEGFPVSPATLGLLDEEILEPDAVRPGPRGVREEPHGDPDDPTLALHDVGEDLRCCAEEPVGDHLDGVLDGIGFALVGREASDAVEKPLFVTGLGRPEDGVVGEKARSHEVSVSVSPPIAGARDRLTSMHAAANERRLTALGDPTRSRILRLIRDSDDGRALVGELAATLGLTQPTISHHMKALLAEGFLVRKPEGRRVWYAIHPDEDDRIAAFLGQKIGPEPDTARIVADLTTRFRGVFGVEAIRSVVTDSLVRLRGDDTAAPFLASRTAAFASSRLEALARADAGPDDTPHVLFVCVQNAGRSQLAAGILRHLAGDRLRVATAGSQPATEVRSSIIAALDEIGIPATGDFPKPLTEEAVRAASVVITMGCGDACPVLPGRRYLDWDLEDPAGLPPAGVRAIRDDIDRRVRALYSELVPAA